jgi:hypothetical protein
MLTSSASVVLNDQHNFAAETWIYCCTTVVYQLIVLCVRDFLFVCLCMNVVCAVTAVTAVYQYLGCIVDCLLVFTAY